jgi:putative transposase
VGAPSSFYEGGAFAFKVSSMPKDLKRIYGLGHLHFITFSCYRRLPLLATPLARKEFVRALGEVRNQYNFLLIGYVVMPEHVHLLISEPISGTPSTVLQMLKQRVSRRIRAERDASDERFPQFWQRRFYDFNVWTQKKKVEKLVYMHMNPVKRGLVEHPKDWPWSSERFYQGRGEVLITIDRVP